MPARLQSSWTLVREAGLDYAQPSAARGAFAWTWPVRAERLPGGEYLVVDDVAGDSDPMRATCRTRVVAPSGAVRFDSQALGLDDAYGCAMDGGRFALLVRGQGELVVASAAGIAHRSSLSAASTRPPALLAWTARGTLLASFLGGINDIDLAELDATGKPLWVRRGLRDVIGIPSSLQQLADGTIVVADEFHHVVWSFPRDAAPAVAWGEWHKPSRAPGRLHRPKAAWRLDDGALLVADAHNHRFVHVARDGTERELAIRGETLAIPAFATPLPGSGWLLCDAGNACVTEIDGAGRIAARLGDPRARGRAFSFPRSVEYLGEARYLVADTGHNRVVVADGAGAVEPRSGDGALFWPRAARTLPGGSLVVADGRNGRVVEVSASGRVARELRSVRHAGREFALLDPHDVRSLADGSVLVVDSEADRVIRAAWNGEAQWIIGAGELRNPHSAQLLPDGRVLVADTIGNRIVAIDPASGTVETVATAGIALKSPKYAERFADAALLVVDSGHHRVLLIPAAGGTVRELSEVPGSPCALLRAPRWAQRVGDDELVVSDHSNHRIVHVRWIGRA